MARKKTGEIITNPNGANQYLFDPRQKLTWDLYIDPKSDTFGNAYQSAMKAGYEEGTAAGITVTNWFLEKARRFNMVNKAERNLDKALDTNYTDPLTGGIRSDVMKIVIDVSKTVVTTLGKNEGYTTKVEQELSNPDGNLKSIVINKYGGDN